MRVTQAEAERDFVVPELFPNRPKYYKYRQYHKIKKRVFRRASFSFQVNKVFLLFPFIIKPLSTTLY